MKKRLLSVGLALALALPMLPAAWAALPNEPRYYELNPYTNASLLGLEADGAYHFKITIAADGAVQSMPLFLASVYASMETSDQKVVGKYGADGAISGGVSYCGRSPGTATVTLSLGKYQSSPKERQAVIDVTVLSPEDFAAYAGDDATHSVQGHTHTYTTTNTPDLGRNLMLHRKVCTECGQWYNMAYERLPDDFDPGTDPNPTPAPDVPHTHNYTSKVTKQPTATQPGVRTYTCTICDDTYTETIPATGVITTGTPIAKTTNSEAVRSTNVHAQDYSDPRAHHASTVQSYLYANDQGGLTRVEYVDGSIVVEDYDSSFKLLSSWSTQPELPVWGGFFAGENYNFMVFGQNNPGESDSVEVIRVVQYTKDWQRINSVSLYGANTETPFRSGSLRCDEYNGYLYIRTCHRMYKSPDGLNHQANVMLSILQNDMSIADAHYIVGNSGYVSHSFNQFVLVNKSGQLVTLDHGDGYPRGLILHQYAADMANGQFTSAKTQEAEIVTFPGLIGANATGCSVGGVAETAGGYVVAYNYDGVGGSIDNDREMYLGIVGKDMSARNVKVGSGVYTTTPQIASTGSDGGYVMWNVKEGHVVLNTLYYLHYGADGTPEPCKTATGLLSDCAPVQFNGKTVWYVTNDSAPVFYTLDASGVTKVRSGSYEQPSGWAAEYVERAIDARIVPYNLRSNYTQPITRAEFCALAVALCETFNGGALPGRLHFVDTDDPNVEKMGALHVVEGVGFNYFLPNNKITREEAATMLFRLAEVLHKPIPGKAPTFSDNGRISDWAINEVGSIQASGIMNGVGNNRFDPQGNYTREQSITTMIRMLDYVQ